MKIKSILWLVVIFLLIFIIWNPKEEKVILADGIYENCYMYALKEESMKVLVDGEVILIPCPVGETIEKRDKIVDITVKDNEVEKIIWKEGLIEDKVDAVNLEEGWIRLANQGQKMISPKGQFYIKTGEDVHVLQKSGSLLIRDKISFYIQEDQVCAVVVAGEEDFQYIRVLLHGEIDGIYHEKAVFTGTEDFVVKSDGQEQTYPAGEKVEVKGASGTHRISCPNGRISMLSLDRSTEKPEYRGEILIDSSEKGLIIRNELKLEEYLYSVVSSEMPSSYPEEALKAQAICARTYAIYQMKQAYYGEYGAHVDDTVNSQVYNNVAETESTKRAVKDTIGQYLSYEREPICAYFYSTSCGSTSDVKDVWISEGESPVYLKGRFQGEPVEVNSSQENAGAANGSPSMDLSSEQSFETFMKNQQENCFEKEEPWFRWSGEVSLEVLASHIEKNLSVWVKSNGATYQWNGADYTIGAITKAEVVERSPGGVIKKVSLTGEKGTLIVTGEYHIRKVMCPDKTSIRLQDGSTRTMTMLPSGYFAIEQGEKLIIRGGGYGHGVGMSQNGAGAMAKKEYKYEDILGFYYPGTELLESY